MPQQQQPPIKHAEKMRRKAVERRHLLAAKGGSMDIPFLLLTLLLTVIGLVMLFSASFPSAFYETNGANPAFYFKRQALFAALGRPPWSWWPRSTTSAGAAQPVCC